MSQTARDIRHPGEAGDPPLTRPRLTPLWPRASAAAAAPSQLPLTMPAAEREAAIGREIRQGLARELHDVVLQNLAGILVEIEVFKLEDGGRARTLEQFEELKGEAGQALRSLRAILVDLREDHDHGGRFIDSIRALAHRLEARTGIVANVRVGGWPSELPPQVGLQLHRIVEEALTNVRFHSGADTVEVVLDAGRAGLSVLIRDDGRGIAGHGEAGSEGMGITGMRERADLLGGRLILRSAPGEGTTVEATLPTGAGR